HGHRAGGGDLRPDLRGPHRTPPPPALRGLQALRTRRGPAAPARRRIPRRPADRRARRRRDRGLRHGRGRRAGPGRPDHAPARRPDLTIREDLIEEIARLVGYESIPSLLPTAPGGRGLTRAQRARRAANRALAEAGLVEVTSYPFVGEGIFDALRYEADDAR